MENHGIELHERMREVETKVRFLCEQVRELTLECEQCRAKKMIDWAIRLILGAVIVALIALVLRR